MKLSGRIWWLVTSCWFLAAAVTGLALLGQLPLARWLIVLPLVACVYVLVEIVKNWRTLSTLEHFLLLILGGVWLSHFIQVGVPETGFDAVWYHLPVMVGHLQAGGLQYDPTLYQSVNPQWSDFLFIPGWLWLGELGSKLTAYALGGSLMLVSYGLARVWLRRHWAVAVAITVSLFQVVAWQSASFYVDIPKAVWEVALVWWLVRETPTHRLTQWWVVAGALWGAALGTKLFSLFLWPAVVLCWGWLGLQSKKTELKGVSLAVVVAWLVPLPFYWFAWQHTGLPWYALSRASSEFAVIGGTTSQLSYLWQRTLLLPWSWVTLARVRDYTSILIVVGLPLLIWQWRSWWSDWRLKLLAWWAVWQWGLWWYLPPLSTRYALSGFIALAVLVMIALAQLWRERPRWRRGIMAVIVLSWLIAVAPRLYVNYRSWKYLSGMQTRQQYLQQFLDGWIDPHLRGWHQF